MHLYRHGKHAHVTLLEYDNGWLWSGGRCAGGSPSPGFANENNSQVLSFELNLRRCEV